MIIRDGTAPVEARPADDAVDAGVASASRVSDTGGLTQFGAYVQTLQPGARSSDRHWHEQEDEFLYMLSGEAMLIENDGPHVIGPGDAVCWKAGVANGHHLVNRSAAPCSYLIVGTRVAQDVCHYPDLGRTLHTEAETWRLTQLDGTVIRHGKI